VWRTKGVVFGGADGMIYENWNFEGQGTGNWVVGDLGSSIGAIAGDGLGYRSLVGAGTDVYRRDVNTLQQWEVLADLVGAHSSSSTATSVMALDYGNGQVEEGVNFFVGVTDTGETFLLAKCDVCLGDCLTA
jgi:hypothetical protein